MRLSIKFKLSSIILFIICCTILSNFYFIVYENKKNKIKYFEKKASEKEVRFKEKQKRFFEMFTDFKKKYIELFKENCLDDFEVFCKNIQNDILANSLTSQTEHLKIISEKYSDKSYILIVENDIILISNNINYWNVPFKTFLEKNDINIKIKQFNENQKYFLFSKKIDLNKKKLQFIFYISKIKINKFLYEQKQKFFNNAKIEKQIEEQEIKTDLEYSLFFSDYLYKQNLYTILIIFFISCFFIFLFLKILSQKFKTLNYGVKQLQKNRLNFRIKNKTIVKDELDDLTEQINIMSEKIENIKINEIKDSIDAVLKPANYLNSNFFIKCKYLPSKEVSGDFYDFFKISEDKYSFLISDIVGKSLPAAFLMNLALTTIRLFSRQYDDMNLFLNKLNEYLYENTVSGKWITLIYGIIDISKNELYICNCGHPTAYLYHHNKIKEINATYPMIGQIEPSKFIKYSEYYKIKFNKDDILFLYTDGLSEIKINNDFLSPKQLFSEFIEKYNLKIENFDEYLEKKISSFDIKDDLTYLLLKKL